jgi:rhodanese-related sulfurtransferase
MLFCSIQWLDFQCGEWSVAVATRNDAGPVRLLQLTQEVLMAQHNPGFLAIVDEARGRISETDVATIRDRLAKGEELTLIDVREESEYAAGHLPGAIHIGRGVIERDIESKIPDHDQEIVLYCGGGFRSALAADNLQKMGYTNVISMDGGFTGWRTAGLDIEGASE